VVVKVTVAVPTDTPVRTPVDEPTVKMLGSLLLQVPAPAELVKVLVVPQLMDVLP
jgi:hypothetical protein